MREETPERDMRYPFTGRERRFDDRHNRPPPLYCHRRRRRVDDAYANPSNRPMLHNFCLGEQGRGAKGKKNNREEK